jgi:hypothetical protein
MIKPLIYRPLIVLSIWCGEPQKAYSQLITAPTGAEQWMLAGSSAAITNVFSTNNNAGAITQIKSFQAGLYSEQRFTESHLQTANVCLVVPTKHLHIGGSINYFGYSAFNQQRMSISVAKQLSPAFSLGVQLNYVSTFIQDYGTTGSPALAIGIYSKPLSKLSLAFVVFNPTQSTYGKNSKDPIPTYARLGCGYTLTEKVKLVAEADQQLNTKLIWRGGVYYQIHEVLALAMGVSNNATHFTFGTSLKLKKVKVDIAVSVHEVLGITPHLAIVFPVVK